MGEYDYSQIILLLLHYYYYIIIIILLLSFTVCNIILSYHVYIDTTYVYLLYIALMMLRCSDETLAN